MTIFDNMAFGLRLAKKPKDFIQQTVPKTANTLGLEKSWTASRERSPEANVSGWRSVGPSCETRGVPL